MPVLVGLIIGLVLGLTGAGGSLFAVPLLVLLLQLPLHEAMGIALGAVAFSALFGLIIKRGRDIIWAPALVIMAAGVITAPAGRWASAYLDEQWLLLSFSVLIVLVAVRMWRQASRDPESARVVRSQSVSGEVGQRVPVCQQDGRSWQLTTPCVMMATLGGLGVGFLSGLLGVGGGFLIVPLLNLVAGLTMRQAVSSSLLVISLVSFTGFVSYCLFNAVVDPVMLSKVGAGGMVGMLLGAGLGSRLAGSALQKVFAILLMVTLLAMWLRA